MNNKRKKELEKKLSQRQINFCREYVFDWNGARSARSAGYSEKGARQRASELLTNRNILDYVEIIKNDFEELLGISKAKVIKEQMNIAFASIAHYHNTWISRKEFDELTDEQKSAIQEIEFKTRKYGGDALDEDGETADVTIIQVKLKLYEKGKALEALAKLLKYNESEDININTPEKSPFVGMSFDELYALKYGKKPKGVKSNN